MFLRLFDMPDKEVEKLINHVILTLWPLFTYHVMVETIRWQQRWKQLVSSQPTARSLRYWTPAAQPAVWRKRMFTLLYFFTWTQSQFPSVCAYSVSFLPWLRSVLQIRCGAENGCFRLDFKQLMLRRTHSNPQEPSPHQSSDIPEGWHVVNLMSILLLWKHLTGVWCRTI